MPPNPRQKAEKLAKQRVADALTQEQQTQLAGAASAPFHLRWVPHLPTSVRRNDMSLPPKGSSPFPYIAADTRRYQGCIPKEHYFSTELAARSIYEPEGWKYWREKGFQHCESIAYGRDEVLVDPRFRRWPLPLPYNPLEAFMLRQWVESGRQDTDAMDMQWQWREDFDRFSGHEAWRQSKWKVNTRIKASSKGPASVQRVENTHNPANPTAPPSQVTEVLQEDPQRPSLPPSWKEDDLLPPHLNPGWVMKFAAIPQPLRFLFDNPPRPHPLASQLEFCGYYEPKIFQFWRANPLPRGSDGPSRHDRLVVAQSDPELRLWPLPLPYETYLEFVERRQQVVGRPLSDRQVRAMKVQIEYRDLRDPTLKARREESIAEWNEKQKGKKPDRGGSGDGSGTSQGGPSFFGSQYIVSGPASGFHAQAGSAFD